MKKIILFAILLTAVTSAKSQDVVNLKMDREQLGLRGPVVSMDEDLLLKKEYFRDDWPTRKWFLSDLRQFLQEDNGRVIDFYANGRLRHVSYTMGGKVTTQTNCSYANNGLLTSFAGEGYKMTATYTNPGNSAVGPTANINLYAETKNYVSKKGVDLATANLSTVGFTYSYPFDLKCEQKLNTNGQVLESRYYYIDNKPAKECFYSYNAMGLLKEERIVDHTGAYEQEKTVTYNYDGRGFLTSKYVKSLAGDENYTYDNNELGDCVRMTVDCVYGSTEYSYEYVYDDHNNWVSRLQFKDEKFDCATLRTFAYGQETVASKKQQQELAYDDEDSHMSSSSTGSAEKSKKGFSINLGKKDKGEAAVADNAKAAKSGKAGKDNDAAAVTTTSKSTSARITANKTDKDGNSKEISSRGVSKEEKAEKKSVKPAKTEKQPTETAAAETKTKADKKAKEEKTATADNKKAAKGAEPQVTTSTKSSTSSHVTSSKADNKAQAQTKKEDKPAAKTETKAAAADKKADKPAKETASKQKTETKTEPKTEKQSTVTNNKSDKKAQEQTISAKDTKKSEKAAAKEEKAKTEAQIKKEKEQRERIAKNKAAKEKAKIEAARKKAAKSKK